MRIAIAFDRGEQPWAHDWKIALGEGMRVHGDHVMFVPASECIATNADVTVTWGLRRGRTGMMQAQKARGKRHLIMELGYFGNREEWTSLGFDGLNGRADFRNQDVPGDRWAPHADLMKDWRGHEGEYVLILGQVSGDTAVEGTDIQLWYLSMALALLKAGITPAFRPHPVTVQREMPIWRHREVVTLEGGSLSQAIALARWVVTFNSNSGVDAVLGGVPAVSSDDGSMIACFGNTVPTQPPSMPDRERWAHRLAYCQWTKDEIRAGLAWEHLRPGAMS